MLDVNKIRSYFPIYKNNENLHYLDSAASTLKNIYTINAIDDYMNNCGVNVHRGVYKLSYEATDKYEEARSVVAKFINADTEEIVFTRGASNSLNLVALSYGMKFLEEDDEVITTELEHQSSHMPWFNVCNIKKAKLKYIPLDKEGRITVDGFKKVLSKKTKVLAITHVSNVMGYITPIKEIIKICKENNVIVSLDGAQSVPHMKIDVKDLNCDFFSFSSHKMTGPTGVGVLYGKKELLNKMDPVEFGGDMALDVSKDEMTYKCAPYKFETGTPMILEVIGLAKACEFLEMIGLENIKNHEEELKNYCLDKLSKISGVTIYNKTTDTGVISFSIDGVHPHDAASVFDKNNVCLRAGLHCAQLINRWLGIWGTLRISFYMYNNKEDVDAFINSVIEVKEFFL